PILTSALLFGIAHFGYGPEPVPIYLLGLVLGYVYQRTHRILPGVVTHSLFNSFSMVIVWWTTFHSS
ncbi:MAG TPA: CPBP family intramembrane glutamic endopeptidase, partial [Lacipirellulaceae bacterium]|nr:CPBP family intramembrane glutamic endopeptidase [Lacipirellulaceae bacterium]